MAYGTEDNPGLSVLHFTDHPVGFVEFPIRSQDSHQYGSVKARIAVK
ncbi:MAG: hypothetical protein HWQ38_14350 [Nostoc sp. NMS7]|nr:hypothetical protein [Nostoc sp. NMS7]MBN3947573.1 hypothetical protein [Nostoc sp. NMS7]